MRGFPGLKEGRGEREEGVEEGAEEGLAERGGVEGRGEEGGKEGAEFILMGVMVGEGGGEERGEAGGGVVMGMGTRMVAERSVGSEREEGGGRLVSSVVNFQPGWDHSEGWWGDVCFGKRGIEKDVCFILSYLDRFLFFKGLYRMLFT